MKHQKLETLPEISKRMSQVKLKRGVAETMLAKALWHRGVRYRLNFRALAGSPDIAITKQRVAVFVDGEFWHGHDWEIRKPKLKRNREYWIEKIEENMARDKRNDTMLEATGWSVIHFWEKEVLKNLDACTDAVVKVISVQRVTNQDISNIVEFSPTLMVEPGALSVAESSSNYTLPNKQD